MRRATENQEEKARLRIRARQIRASLDIPALSTTLCQKLAQEPDWQAAQNILLYLPMPEEVQVEPLLETPGKCWFMPRCAPGRRLAIHPYLPGETALRSGPFGIREPDAALVPEAEPGVLDLVVVPALLLTHAGARLGYGGGYYDRFLPGLRRDCRKIGMLPAELVVPELPTDPWDVSLDRIINTSPGTAP